MGLGASTKKTGLVRLGGAKRPVDQAPPRDARVPFFVLAPQPIISSVSKHVLRSVFCTSAPQMIYYSVQKLMQQTQAEHMLKIAAVQVVSRVCI